MGRPPCRSDRARVGDARSVSWPTDARGAGLAPRQAAVIAFFAGRLLGRRVELESRMEADLLTRSHLPYPTLIAYAP
jgi:hypothetical protein